MVLKSDKLARLIANGMAEKKANDIVIMDMTKIPNSMCDFFVISHGESSTQVAAIADSVFDFVKKSSKESPTYQEGYQNSEWILLDYYNVIAHVFQKNTREHYKLEKLWADAKITTVD